MARSGIVRAGASFNGHKWRRPARRAGDCHRVLAGLPADPRAKRFPARRCHGEHTLSAGFFHPLVITPPYLHLPVAGLVDGRALPDQTRKHPALVADAVADDRLGEPARRVHRRLCHLGIVRLRHALGEMVHPQRRERGSSRGFLEELPVGRRVFTAGHPAQPGRPGNLGHQRGLCCQPLPGGPHG